jgi:hypothetical protein
VAVAEKTAVTRAPPFAAELTVTFCGVFQFAVVNVREAGAAVRSVLPDERATATVTEDDG